jgi:hypothetical protein
MANVHYPTLLQVLKRYDANALPELPKRCDPGDSMVGTENEDQQLQHLKYMVLQIHSFATAGRNDKVMRWLCWMQGVLWSLGYVTLDECRVDVYRILHDGAMPTVDEMSLEIGA